MKIQILINRVNFKYLLYLFNIMLLLCCSYNSIYSQQLIYIPNLENIHYVDSQLTIQMEQYSMRKIKLYYSMDTGKTWIRINEQPMNNIVNFTIPFTISPLMQIKAVSERITPLELIWENREAHRGEIRATNFSPDGKLLLTLGTDGWIKIWEIPKRTLVDQLYIENNEYTYDARFFHSSTQVIFSSGNNTYLWDRTNNTVSIFYTIGNFIRKMDVHPKDNKFAVITDDNNLAVFQQTFLLPFPIFLRLYSNNTYKNSYSVRYSQSGNRIAVSTYSGKVIITNADYFQQDVVLNLSRSPLFCSEFCNNDQYLAYPGEMNTLNLYELNTQTTNQLMPPFQGTIRDIKRFKSNYVAAGALDGTLQEWDLEDFTNLPVTIQEPYGILNLDFTSTGDTLATSGRANAFRIWRNFGYDTISQIIDVRVRQIINVQITTNKNPYYPGDSCGIAILFNTKYQDTLSKFPLWHFTYDIFIPNHLFAIDNGQFFPNDAINDKTTYNFVTDTFKLYKGIAILTDQNTSEIQVNHFKPAEPNNFSYVMQWKDVMVLYTCPLVPPPKISVINAEFNIVQSGDNDGDLHLDANLIEDGDFSVEIYSLDGKMIKQINQNLKHGFYSFNIDLKSYSSGVYIIKAQNVSQVKYLKYVKF
ncbi:MAG TPA: T9SS type A sorting domain-containing protein [Bacteroidota bacterium]|nr:T9SS type A sorting domain-containing protein [Bacteroidota bacterium]